MSDTSEDKKWPVKRVVTSDNCLASVNPRLAAEWHPTKNGDLTSNNVRPGSRKKAWWRCHICGHEWDARVNSRIVGNGCPACSGKAATSANCLANVNPELAVEWHTTKNRKLTPCDVTPGSSKKAWWQCPVCGHEWEAVVASRNSGVGCPACSGHATTLENCLATVNPALAAEWHPTKNGDLTSHDVTSGSGKKVWWKCHARGHEWEAIVGNRSKGVGCPACAGQVATPENCLAAVNPALAAEWHPTKNKDLTTDKVMSGSSKKAWWQCPVCGHEWEAVVASRNSGIGCPGCSGKAVTPKNCLATVNPILAAEWHPTKNRELTAYDVTPGSSKKAWWQCRTCDHKWDATVASRSQGNGCPACAGRTVTSKNCFAITHPDLAIEWHPTRNGTLTPSDVSYGAHKRVWWQCRVCGHEWEVTVANRCCGSGCPACAGQDVTPENCLAAVNPVLAEEWHPTRNGDLTPYDVMPRTGQKAWWQCRDCDHEWDATVASRSGGAGCPACANAGTSFPEKAVLYYMRECFGDSVRGESSVRGMSVDVYIPHLRLAIEYDGEYYHRDRREKDELKNKQLQLNGIKMVRVSEPGLSEIAAFGSLVVGGDTLLERLHNLASCLLANCKVNKHELDNLRRLIGLTEADLAVATPTIEGMTKSDKKQRSLASINPGLASEWHQTKNGKISPNNVLPGSNKKVWWQCRTCGYEWRAAVNSRNRGNGCPACAGWANTPESCLAATNPSLASEWHPTKNGDLTPSDVKPGTSKKAWWQCRVCNHEWDATVASRSQGNGCPACAGRVVTPKNCLATVKPSVASEWHPSRNGNLTPYDVIAGSTKKIWWKCHVCGHEWEALVYSRSSDHGCPACAGHVATSRNCLAAVNPSLAAEWHPTRNGDLTANHVTVGTNKKVWWRCHDCGHEWEATVASRSVGNGCPACAGRVVTRGLIKNRLLSESVSIE